MHYGIHCDLDLHASNRVDTTARIEVAVMVAVTAAWITAAALLTVGCVDLNRPTSKAAH